LKSLKSLKIWGEGWFEEFEEFEDFGEGWFEEFEEFEDLGGRAGTYYDYQMFAMPD
jgi:hypothetical protein